MKTVCMSCGASWGEDLGEKFLSHGYCAPCAEKELEKTKRILAAATCGSELRRNDEVLDRCELIGPHSGKAHRGKYGRWATSGTPEARALGEIRRGRQAP